MNSWWRRFAEQVGGKWMAAILLVVMLVMASVIGWAMLRALSGVTYKAHSKQPWAAP